MTNVVETMLERAIVTENTITDTIEVSVSGPQGIPGPAGPGVPVGGNIGQILKKASSADFDTYWSESSGVGTVTSVALAAPTGFAVSGSPITGSGTLTLSFAADYSLPTNTSQTNWDAAYSWGNHALAGYAHAGANTDITSMSGITGGIGTADYVQFDTAAAAIGAVGRILWNDTDGTLEFQMKGGNVTQQIGQELVLRVTNQSGTTMVDGQVVYITGSTGNHLNVALAQANTEITSSKTIAVITESIANNGSGFATTNGLIHDLNTSALIEGAAIWLSPTIAGGLTATKPQAPDHAVLIGWCVRQHASVGVIYIHIANGYELNELHDVKITGTPAAGSLVIRNATSGLWENANLTAGTAIGITNADKSITITNTAPDQVVALTGAGTTSVTGTYPNFTITTADQYTGTVTSVGATAGTGISVTGSPITSSGSFTITNTAPDQVVALTGSTGISITGAYPSFTITNTAPDQVVSLTAGSNVTVTGTYPNFTIAATGGGSGTVTSVAATVPTGFTISGSPITTSGTLAIAFDTGYSLPTTASQTNWNSVYTVWGAKTAPSGTVVGTSDTQTLTNKRITPRINAQTTTTSPWAWNSDSYDQQSFSALANALTINADAGTPTDGQKAIFRFKDNGSAQALTWTTGTSKSFRAVGVTLPTTTVISKTVYVGCVYNAADSRWDAVAVAQEA